MNFIKVHFKSEQQCNRMHVRRLTRFISTAIGQSSGVVFFALLLFACTSSSEERSDSADTLGTQQPAAQQIESGSDLRPPETSTAPVAREAKDKPETSTPKAVKEVQTQPEEADQVVKEKTLKPHTKTKSALTIAEVLAKHSGKLTDIHGVVLIDSVACGGGSCIQITVVRRTHEILSKLPARLEGYEVIVVEKKGSH
jgi:hypothetical protein